MRRAEVLRAEGNEPRLIDEAGKPMLAFRAAHRWGRGAAGSAPRWHRGGRGLEPHRLHQTYKPRGSYSRNCCGAPKTRWLAEPLPHDSRQVISRLLELSQTMAVCSRRVWKSCQTSSCIKAPVPS